MRGESKLDTYLNFPGTCAQAFRYYEQHLGAKIGMMMTFAQMPEPKQFPPGMENGVLHGTIQIAGRSIMASDVANAKPMRSAYLCVATDSDDDAERIYKALGDGGEVFMPMGETFFATPFAQLRDRFGIAWMVIHERPMTGSPNPG